MELSVVVAKRRMVRSFTGHPVPAHVLDDILATACRAPTAGNAAGWEAVVLVGPEETGLFWEATTSPDWRRTSRRWAGLSRAPVIVALFVTPGAYLARYAEPDKASGGLNQSEDAWPVPYWFVDGGFAAMLLLLAAIDHGLGACFLGNFRGEAELHARLGVPADRRYAGAVLLGEPDAVDPPSLSVGRGRRQVEGAVHRGRW
jgi:nitroreductase